MNLEDTPAIVILGEFAPAPKSPTPTYWDWIKYYVYNWARKPLVWKRKKDLIHISEEVRCALSKELFPQLWEKRSECPDCRDALLALRSQVFLSQIETLLRRMACPEHPSTFDSFLKRYQGRFAQSEDIAAWINGFKR